VSVRVTLNGLGRVAEARPLSAFPLVFAGQPATPDALRAAGEALVTAATDAVRQWQYESPAQPPVAFTVTLAFAPGLEPSLISEDGSPLPDPRAWTERARVPIAEQDPSYSPDWATGTPRVGQDVTQPRRVVHVAPVYPQAAREQGIQGLVIVDALTDADGTIVEIRRMRSTPLLTEAAIEAIRQWRFEPTIVNGQAVPVVMTLAVNFSLP
jgi:TonB family protein